MPRHPRQHAQQRGLARAVRSDQREHATVDDLQTDSGEQLVRRPGDRPSSAYATPLTPILPTGAGCAAQRVEERAADETR
jgi:hypothetical protein